MAYVSCRYAPPPDPNLMPGAQQMIVCVDENGTEWWVPPDCQVGDWLRYVEDGGEVTPYEEPS